MSRQAPATTPPRQGRNKLRIIGGKWRGRKLDFPSVEGLRPTGDRIRETLFNWLAAATPGAHCLDLFAGSGALGLECLSRGAASALLLDRDPQVVTRLREHCRTLQAENARVELADTLNWLASAPAESFDLVFIDPPFQADLLSRTAGALNASNCLRDEALIYVEVDQHQHFAPPLNWSSVKEKRAGQVSFFLFRYRKSA